MPQFMDDAPGQEDKLDEEAAALRETARRKREEAEEAEQALAEYESSREALHIDGL